MVAAAFGFAAAANIAGVVQESNLLKVLPHPAQKPAVALVVAFASVVAWATWAEQPDVSLRQIWKLNYS